MAIARNNQAALLSATGTTFTTGAYVASSGVNRFLLLFLIGDTTNDDITAVTYGGQALTLLLKFTTAASTDRFIYFYYKLGAPTGSNTFTVTCTNSHFLQCIAADYTGVSQVAPTVFTSNSVASATTLTTSVTTPVPNCWTILCEDNTGASGAATAGAGVTIVQADGQFNNATLFDSNAAIASAGSYSMTTNENSAGKIAHLAAAIAPPGGCGSTVPLLGVGCSIGWRASLLAGAAWRAGKAIERNGIIARRSLILPSREC